MADGRAARSHITVGRQVRRWRAERGLTLAAVAEESGLNLGYLSQIENDKASPSLDALGAIAAALDVPAAWLLIAESTPVRVVRAAERTSTAVPGGGRIEQIDGRLTKGFSMVRVTVPPGTGTGPHAHGGEEHHLVVRGRWRMRQGDEEVELGPGDYVAWDGTVPHEAEVIGDEAGELLIVSRRHPTRG